MILSELQAYSPALFEKPRLVAFSKADLDPEHAARPRRRWPGRSASTQFHVVSAVTGEGLPALLEDCWRLLKGGPDS